MPGTRLFGASWWKAIKALLLCEIIHVSFFFFRQDQLKHWMFRAAQWQELVFDCLKQVHWNRTMSSRIIINVCRDLKVVCILIWLKRCTENQIFFRNSFFSNADMNMFLYWLIECLQVNRMCITGKKAKHIAIYCSRILFFSKYFP